MTRPKAATGLPYSNDVLGELPEPSMWMTYESMYRLADGGNVRGTVPVHGKSSATATIPLYTAEQMEAERKRCFKLRISR